MIPRLNPTLGFDEIKAAANIFQRHSVEHFEEEFAALMGQKHAIAFPYGRTGLIYLLRAMGFEKRRIICPAYTCVVVPHSIVYSGNHPTFIDANPYDFNMNLELVPGLITDNTAAIIATSIHGYPTNLDALRDIHEQNPNVKIIQDCAHSFGAKWNGEPVQSFGEAAIFGLNISKIINSVFGGMITTNNKKLADKIRTLRNSELSPAPIKKSLMRMAYLLAVYPAFCPPVYGFINALERSGFLNRFVKYFDEGKIDMPADYLVKMTELEARVGRVQINRYEDVLEQKRQAAMYYNENLQDLDWLELPPIVEGATYSHYVARVDNREKLMKFALKKGVQLGQIIEYFIPGMPSYQSRYPRYAQICKETRALAQRVINLPVSKGLKGAQKTVKVLSKWNPEKN